MRLVRDLRLLPVVILAAAALLLLKLSWVALDQGQALIASRVALAQGNAMPPVQGLDDARAGPTGEPKSSRGDRARSWAQENLGYPETTGSVTPKPAEPAAPATKPATQAATPGAAPAVEPQGAPQAVDPSRPPMTAGERAVLESLVKRREELEARAREIEVRENLLKAAEQRVEARLQELAAAEARLNGAVKKRDDAEVAKFKNLVSMYENMKPKDAAKVFDRLEMRILIEVVSLMNPRRMSDILALMNPEAAEKLTIEIANRSGPDRPPLTAELPKIEGKPKR